MIGESRSLGFLGPGPIDVQLRHAEGFVPIAKARIATGARMLDLGAGGGIPGLVVACVWPEVRLMLLDANGRRTDFLRRALGRLGMSDRVEVMHERAEVAGRTADLRGKFDAVLARSFGRPAVVAECAAPFLRTGGWLIVSEPPASTGSSAIATAPGAASGPRWPVGPLEQLGLEPAEAIHAEFEYQTLRQRDPCPDRYPRRDGVPARKPLF
jgi:16S rRNA (guanine527-N7)-methyltransferase